MYKHTIILFLFVFNIFPNGNIAYGQVAIIDQSLLKAEKLYLDEKFNEAHEYFQEIIKQSQAIGYSKGLAKGYYGSAKTLFVLKERGESTRLLLLAEKESYAKHNYEFLSEVYFQMALNLHSIQVYEEALNKYKKSVEFANRIKDLNARNDVISTRYVNIGDVYQLLEQHDSAFYYYYKGYHLVTRKPEIKLLASLSLVDLYIAEKKMDSADKYLKLSAKYYKKENSLTYGAILELSNGKYELAAGNYREALKKFKKAQQMNAAINIVEADLFQLQAETFAKLNETDSANFYLRKYVEYGRENKFKNIRNNKSPILIKENEKKKLEEHHLRLNIIIISGSVLLIIAACFFIFKLREKHSKSIVENSNLKKQLNASFDEIVVLAKNNSPQFLSRFKDAYPEFHSALLKLQPELTSSELVMCAYMKLDFSAKEIAGFTFSSFRTVQNKKYKIRKKLNLDSKVDLNRWAQDLDH